MNETFIGCRVDDPDDRIQLSISRDNKFGIVEPDPLPTLLGRTRNKKKCQIFLIHQKIKPKMVHGSTGWQIGRDWSYLNKIWYRICYFPRTNVFLNAYS